ncbi:hypothetical protein [Horticoccus sp. 23ND18S-11]|uniref:hypothetical protein n=1 Tax=Horticoccus sp. 23ND18S-11 TaxID=3391832 RepID=UPI0039C9281D
MSPKKWVGQLSGTLTDDEVLFLISGSLCFLRTKRLGEKSSVDTTGVPVVENIDGLAEMRRVGECDTSIAEVTERSHLDSITMLP